MGYPVPENEAERLIALQSYGLVATPPELDFDEIAELAAYVCGCPVGVVNLIAEKWEWYKGRWGIPNHLSHEPRGGVCSTTICGPDLLIIPDLTQDARFAGQEMVAGHPHFRFYAGMPIINPDGYALGSLCVLDYQPRQIDSQQIKGLRSLTRQAVAQLEIRRRLAELEEFHRDLAAEKSKSEALLLNILPPKVAEELRAQGHVLPRYHESVTILFTDFCGFTQLAENLEPRALVEELDEHFSAFDDIITRHGLEKIKTIGDAYMCAAGLPAPIPDHALNACSAALSIRDHMARVNTAREKYRRPRWDIRIGIHTGGVIAGVVGKKKFTYDIWGDAVNVAAVMVRQADAGQIALSEGVVSGIRGAFQVELCQEVDTKKGRVSHFILKAPQERCH